MTTVYTTVLYLAYYNHAADQKKKKRKRCIRVPATKSRRTRTSTQRCARLLSDSSHQRRGVLQVHLRVLRPEDVEQEVNELVGVGVHQRQGALQEPTVGQQKRAIISCHHVTCSRNVFYYYYLFIFGGGGGKGKNATPHNAMMAHGSYLTKKHKHQKYQKNTYCTYKTNDTTVCMYSTTINKDPGQAAHQNKNSASTRLPAYFNSSKP